MAQIQPMSLPLAFQVEQPGFINPARNKAHGARLINHQASPAAKSEIPNGDGIDNDNPPPSTPESVKRRIQAVKETWGNKLICHPAYQYNPRHSHDRDIYGPARQPFLNGIAERARLDREKNPAYQRAMRRFSTFQENAL